MIARVAARACFEYSRLRVWIRVLLRRERRRRRAVAPGRSPGRRALLVYLPRAVLLDPGHPDQHRHQNMTKSRMMAQMLGERGYAVDVVHKADTLFRPHEGYDLVLSERIEWGAALPLFGDHPVWAFLATSTEPRAHNRAVAERHRRLRERRGRWFEPRPVYHETLPALDHSEVVVGVGNRPVMDTWRTRFAGDILSFDNFAYAGTPSSLQGKDFEAARRHFFFFASGRQVRKGLDLCLEAFARLPDLHLHVCSGYESEPDFCEHYRKELFESPNVHPAGWVRVNGPEFARVARTCASAVHPSCSEGQAGSVVQCMCAGLVPLVTAQSGIDTGGFGVTFADDELDTIVATIAEHAERPAAWHAERAQAARERALADHSEQRFRERMSEILDELDQRVGDRA